METLKRLPIVGHGDRPVPNTFLRAEDPTDRLAILLPGYGYTCDMPLFYYATELLLGRGFDLLAVEYAYNRDPSFGALPGAERRHRLLADTGAAVATGLAQRPYRQAVFVGKSLGTLAMGHLLTEEASPERSWRAVWLTPLFHDRALRQQIDRFAGPSLFVIGTADRDYDRALLAELAGRPGNRAVVIEGADHGLDVPGDPVASVAALGRYVAALQEWLAASPDGA